MVNDTSDYTLANMLLIGFMDFDERGLPTQKYLDDDSEARQAIARLLRSDKSLPRQLRECLATLFEPEPTCEIGGERQLVFKFRRRGNRRNAMRNSAIFSHVWAGTKEKETQRRKGDPRNGRKVRAFL